MKDVFFVLLSYLSAGVPGPDDGDLSYFSNTFVSVTIDSLKCKHSASRILELVHNLEIV